MTENPVVILTALDVEYDEVRAGLHDVRTQVHPAGTHFDVGHIGADGPLVALTLTGRGNLPAGTLTERAITYFSPIAVIFVGVAGACRSDIELGDVVVATHVYAYHGATSEDDGTWARPRVWETAHSADQTARHVARDRAWAHRLPADPSPPQVHFGPIAAGEQVHYSKISPNASWLREHYNDAIAVEMEAAGVAQASHLNDALPMAVVRGISDLADATKAAADRAGWQRRAAASAAAFALTLATELAASPPRQQPNTSYESSQPTAPVAMTSTISGTAQVGAVAGQIFGDVRNSFGAPLRGGDVLALLADLRAHLDQACHAGRVEEEVGQAALEELDAATKAAQQQQGGRMRVAVRKLSGLIGDLAEFAGKLAAIVSAARSMT
jgi:8-oxo-dGTP diphosphatase